MKRSIFLLALITAGFVLSGLACAQPVPGDKAPEIRYREFTGIVTAVDPAAMTISVAKNARTETFAVDGNTTIKMKKEYKLAEIPVKSKVFVRYKEAAGTNLAVRIQIIKLSRAIKGAK